MFSNVLINSIPNFMALKHKKRGLTMDYKTAAMYTFLTIFRNLWNINKSYSTRYNTIFGEFILSMGYTVFPFALHRSIYKSVFSLP